MRSICYFIEGLYNSGGMERVLSVCANSLCNDFDISIATINQKNKPIYFPLEPSIKVYDLNVADYKEKKKLRNAISNQLMKHKYDIVVSLGGIDLYYLHAINDGSKKIVWFHFAINIAKTVWVGINPSWKRRCLAQLQTWKRIYHACKYDKIVVLTRADYKRWKRYSSKVVQLYNPITLVNPGISSRIEKSVISVGRLDFQKGYDFLIDAWKSVNSIHPDWHLDIFGEGPLRDVLQRQIDRHGLSRSITLRGRTSDVTSQYCCHSIFIMSSRAEGFPLVLLEAASCGLPLVSFACPEGPEEIIEDGVNGFLIYNVGDSKRLAEKICELIDSRELRDKMGKNANIMVKSFSVDQITKQWREFFLKL